MEEVYLNEVFPRLSLNERLSLTSLNKRHHEKNRNERLLHKPVTVDEIVGRKCVIAIIETYSANTWDGRSVLVKETISHIVDQDGEIQLSSMSEKSMSRIIYPKSSVLSWFIRNDRKRPYYTFTEDGVYINYESLPKFEVDIATFAQICKERGVINTIQVKEAFLDKLYKLTEHQLHLSCMILNDVSYNSLYNRTKEELRTFILAQLEKIGYV